MGARECIACGCPLSADADRCPLCGAAVPAHAAPTPAGSAGASDAPAGAKAAESGAAGVSENAARSRRAGMGAGVASAVDALRGRRGVLIAVGAAAAVLVAALCIVLLVFGGMPSAPAGGDGTGGEAAGSEGSATAGSSVREAPSASVPGGGTVLADGAGAYLALGDGLYRFEDLTGSSGDPLLLKVSDGRAACVNRWEGGLCFLSGESSAADSFGGARICAVDDESAERRIVQPSVLYEAEGGARLGCLSVMDGAAYFLEESGDEVRALRLASGDSEVQAVGSWTADRAWLFVEDGRVYVATTAGGSWKLEVADAAPADGHAGGEAGDASAGEAGEGEAADDGDASFGFSPVMEGEGSLVAACYAEGAFYYACDAGRMGLAARTAQGGFAEYPDVEGAVRIVAAGDAVAAVTRDGGFSWVDTETGLAMDKSSKVETYLPDAQPSRMGVGMAGEFVIVTDGSGAFLACSRADGSAFGGYLDDAVDSATAA